MKSPSEIQIADVLSVARSQLVSCEVILHYPKKFNKNYNPSSIIDNFWMNTCKTFYYDSLLLTSTLLDKDPRTISFLNWKSFKQEYLGWLEKEINDFEKLGLKTVRDQVIGHVDMLNPNNRLPRHRRQGIINEILVDNLRKIQNELIDKFDEFTRKSGQPYSRSSFFEGNEARNEVELAINQAKPELTSNFVGG